MPQPTQYHVVHPIRHNGKPYNRGEKISADKFAKDKDGKSEADRLLKAKVLSTKPVDVDTESEASATE